ncbi:MAG: hypothetical protein BGO95_11665 [Micrococcales bacterium 73-13]|nr:MAG: hypothetical protein BGO95_11665 [Micrococcales bacterium 73-13]
MSLIRRALEDRPAFDPTTDAGTLRVSCSDYSTVVLIAPLVRELTAEAPGVTVEVQPRSVDPVGSLLRAETDLVIEPTAVMRGVSLPSQGLFRDRWLCCLWAGNSRVGDSVSRAEFAELGRIVYSMGRGSPRSFADEHLERSGLRRRAEFAVESFFLAPHLLQGTELVALVPERVVPLLERMASIRVVEPPLEIPEIVQTMWWSPARTTDPAHQWLRERIAAVAARMEPATGAGRGA